MSIQGVDPIIIRSFIEAINNEFFRKEPINEDFWKNQYQGLPINHRGELWMLLVKRYEHMVHGVFDGKSIEREVLFLITAIRKKDKEHYQLLKILFDWLNKNPLEVDEISQFMVQCFQKLW